MNKKVLLMILDGWGIATDKSVSAIDKAQTPFIDSLYGKYPHSKLEASGLAVGLPEGQMGQFRSRPYEYWSRSSSLSNACAY